MSADPHSSSASASAMDLSEGGAPAAADSTAAASASAAAGEEGATPHSTHDADEGDEEEGDADDDGDASPRDSDGKKKKKRHKDKKKHKSKKHRKHREEGDEEDNSDDEGGEEEEEDEGEGGGSDASSPSSASSDSEGGEEDADEDEEAREKKRRKKEKKAAKRAKKEKEREKRRKAKEKSKSSKDKSSVKKRRPKRDAASRFLDVEVEVSSDEEVSADEAEGDEDGFLADLVVPDDEVDADEEAARLERERIRRQKRKRVREEELDDEDYNLIKESLGMAVGPSIDQDVREEEEEEKRAEGGGAMERKRLRRLGKEKFDYEALARAKEEKERARRGRREEIEFEEEEDDGFLAPEDDGSIMGAPRRQKKRREEDDMDDFVEDDTRVVSSHEAVGGEMSSAMKERLRDLFGSVTSFFQGKKGSKAYSAEADGAWGEEEDEPELVDSSAESDEDISNRMEEARRRRQRSSTAPASQRERERKVREVREADIPERLYERYLARQKLLAGLSDEEKQQERIEEATWIFKQLYVNPTSPYAQEYLLQQQRQQQQQMYMYGGASYGGPAPRQLESLLPTLLQVLYHLQEEHLEMAYISTYLKDIWGGRMMHEAARLTEEELQVIDQLDAKWVEIGDRRKRLQKAIENFQASSYIQNLSLSNAGASGAASSLSWLDYATPSSETLDEYKRLLSGGELSGVIELDDVQDAIKVQALIDHCKKRQQRGQRKQRRVYDREMRRRAREEAKQAREERLQRLSEEHAKRREELSNSFEAGASGLLEQEEARMAAEVEAVRNEAEPMPSSDPEEAESASEDDAELLFGGDGSGRASSRSVKSRLHRGQFSVLSKCWSIAGVPALAASLGITPSQMGENVSINYRKNQMREDAVWNVEYLAEEAIHAKQVSNVEEALLAARRYAAFLISSEPLVRREVRKKFMESGELWTFPTAKGVRELDETHEFAGVRRLQGKPLSRMSDHPAQFLLVHQAEKEGLITVELRLPKNTEPVNRVKSLPTDEPEPDELTALLCELFLDNNMTPDGIRWNQQRRLIIHDAMQTYLLPLCHAHARSTLLEMGRHYVAKKVANNLTKMGSMSGFKPPVQPNQPSNEEEEDGRRKKKKGGAGSAEANWRILSLVLGDQWSPSYMAVLNRYGGVVDHLCLHFLKTRAQARGRNGEQLSESERNNYMRKKEDVRRFLEMVNTHSPKLIVLDASSLDSRMFKEELSQKILMDHPHIRVEFASPEVGRIYMNSARAELEFKDYPRLLRQSISMGRAALDPLSELAGLYSGPLDASQWTDSANTSAQLMNAIQAGKNEDEALKKDTLAAATNALSNDMLALSLHPLQRLLPTPLLLSSMRSALVRMVNYNGVDINKVVSRPWLTGSLQFLAGMGPLKAKMMLDYVKKKGYLVNRNELSNKQTVAVKQEEEKQASPAAASTSSKSGLLGPRVYRNCIGFILIRRSVLMDISVSEVHPLDETRIHPSLYEEALTIVHAALDVEEDTIQEEVEKKMKKEKKKSREEYDEDEEGYDDDSRGSKRASREQERLARLTQRIRHEVNSRYIEEAMQPQAASKLDQLDLEAYVKGEQEDAMAKGVAYTPKLETLYLIKFELRDPFGDYLRRLHPFAPPSPSKLFTLLTGETARSLREGMLMSAVVNGIHPGGKGAYMKLDSGLRGFLSMRNVSDSAPMPPPRPMGGYMDPSEAEREINDNLIWLRARLAVGLSVNARVLKVEKDKFMVELSTKSSDLNQQSWVANAAERQQREQMIADKYGRPQTSPEDDELEADLFFHEPYLFQGTHPDDAALLRAEMGPQKVLARFRQRNITHTLFRNFSREEAIAYLRDKPVGELLVRPSSKGTSNLTLTWKVSDEEVASMDPQAGPDAPPEKGIYFHVDIQEQEKPNELEIGTRLVIGRDDKYVFEDLDEVAARFVTPMLKWVQQITAHKNFRYGDEEEIRQVLYAEKQADRNKIPYVLHFATNSSKAGCFQFSFLPNTTVKSSSIVVVPEGFLYHGRTYKSLQALLAGIKAEMSQRVGVAAPAGSQRAAAQASTSDRDRHASRHEERKPLSLPPYAAASTTKQEYPPYAAASRPPASSLPPYAGAAGGNMPPYAAPAPAGSPYAGAAAAMPPYGAAPPYGAPQQHYPPQSRPSYQQPPPPSHQPRFSPPTPYQQPPAPMAAPPAAAPAAAGAASGFVHPSRLGIVSHSQPPQQQQQQAPPAQQPGAYPPYGAYPQQPPPQQAAAPRQSRWGGSAHARNEDMQM